MDGCYSISSLHGAPVATDDSGMSITANTSTRHLIVGGGVIGHATADALRERGCDPVFASRQRPLPGSSDMPYVRLDALDSAAFQAVAAGASHLYLTLGLPYNSEVWERDWPRVMQNAIDAALTHGARLIWFDNLYAYGPVPLQMPIREDHPVEPTSRKGKVRAALLRMLRQAGEQQGLRWLVARSADFYGPAGPLVDALRGGHGTAVAWPPGLVARRSGCTSQFHLHA